jgi:3-oxoacyl-(acyl-carrier-protein) synthase
LAVLAAHQVVEQEGAVPSTVGQKAGMVLGTGYGSHLSNEAFQRLLDVEGPSGASPAIFAYTLPSSAVGAISIHLGLKGPNLTLAQGTGAGLHAVATAARMVEQGVAQWMLAGGVDVLSPTLLRAVGEESGGLLAEGAALIALATKRQRALARLAGSACGFVTGGRSTTARIEHEALSRAGVDPGQLRIRLAYEPECEFPMQRHLGRGLAAAPLLGLCACLSRGGEGSLPALITARDPRGSFEAICLKEP